MKKSSPHRAIPPLSLLISILLVLPLFFWLPKSGVFNLMISLVLILSFSAPITYWILQTRIFPKFSIRLKEYTTRWQWFIIGASLTAGLWLSLNIPLPMPPVERTPFLHPLLVKIFYRLFSAIDLGAIILSACLLVSKAPKKEKILTSQPFQPLSFVKYFLLIALVWGLYLLAFFPGMMSADSFVQWEQMLTGVYNDHHPAFHTFTIWLATRVALTPTSVAIAQILFLGFVAAQWFAFFEKVRLPSGVIWTGAALFALSPVNGTMVNTLWKDIPFSTSVLALSLMLAEITFSKGEWIKTWSAKLLLGVICALVLLFRHDGLPVGVGTLLALAVIYPRKWRSWLIASIVCFGLYFGVRGPLYQAVGVQKTTKLAEDPLPLYLMAAYAKQGSQAEQLIRSFQMVSPDWECRLADKIQPEWRATDLDYSLSLAEIASNLIQRLPRVLLYFYRCARPTNWIVWDPYGEVRNPSHVEVLIDPNQYGIQPDSKIPWLREIVRKWVIHTSHNPSINWFTWRPAFFLYLNLFVSLILIIRYRSMEFGLISLPILIHSIAFSLILAAPNFRYHYAVYLVALASWPLLFSPPNPMNEIKNDDQSHQPRLS